MIFDGICFRNNSGIAFRWPAVFKQPISNVLKQFSSPLPTLLTASVVSVVKLVPPKQSTTTRNTSPSRGVTVDFKSTCLYWLDIRVPKPNTRATCTIWEWKTLLKRDAKLWKRLRIEQVSRKTKDHTVHCAIKHGVTRHRPTSIDSSSPGFRYRGLHHVGLIVAEKSVLTAMRINTGDGNARVFESEILECLLDTGIQYIGNNLAHRRKTICDRSSRILTETQNNGGFSKFFVSSFTSAHKLALMSQKVQYWGMEGDFVVTDAGIGRCVFAVLHCTALDFDFFNSAPTHAACMLTGYEIRNCKSFPNETLQ